MSNARFIFLNVKYENSLIHKFILKLKNGNICVSINVNFYAIVL